MIDHVETLIPMTDKGGLRPDEQQVLIFLQKWAREETFLNADMMVVVLTENISDLDDVTPLAALTAANATEAWTHLKRERRILDELSNRQVDGIAAFLSDPEAHPPGTPTQPRRGVGEGRRPVHHRSAPRPNPRLQPPSLVLQTLDEVAPGIVHVGGRTDPGAAVTVTNGATCKYTNGMFSA